MLEHFGLEGFLSFAKQSPVELGKLTILVGRNSSGKSAFIHAIALLSETVSDTSPATAMLFAGNGLNLGSYADVVHGNDPSNAMRFFLKFNQLPSEDGWFWNADVSAMPHEMRITMRHDSASMRPYLSAVSVYRERKRLFTLQGFGTGTAGGYRSGTVQAFSEKPDTVTARLDHFMPDFVLRSEGSKDKRAWKREAKFLIAGNYLQRLAQRFANAVFLGPSRAALETIYLPTGRYPQKMDSAASNLVPYLIGKTRTAVDRKRLEKTLNEWLGARLGVTSSTSVKSYADGLGFRLAGNDYVTRAAVALSNTGYGVSQVLPLLVQLAVGTPTLLLIEQPELHLHPQAQAELGDLFAKFVEAGYQLVVETHSEHLIYRIRSLVAGNDGPLNADNVRLYHVDKRQDGSHLRPVEIGKTGTLKGWPKGFFSVDPRDLKVAFGGAP